MINKIKYIGFFFAILIFIWGCGEKPFFDEAHDFAGRQWQDQDTVRFSFDVTDTVQTYDMVFTLRTSTDYAYNNLWFYVCSTAPDNSTSKVAQRIPLAHPSGAWIGRVSGTIVESKLHFNSAKFPLTGPYLIEVILATQQPVINNVYDFGLRITKNIAK